MKKFLTKFDIKLYPGVEMNPYDAVDRLSYVDSTVMIARMLSAGVNMKLQNSQLMAYDNDMNAPSIPVYAPDIAVAYKKLHALQDELKENQRIRTEQLKAAKEAAAKEAAPVSPEKGASSDLP